MSPEVRDTIAVALFIGVPLSLGTAITFALEHLFKRWGW